MAGSRFIDLIPTQRPTVKVKGEYYHRDVLRNVPSGIHSLELIPEPDNPYDHYAISVRYKGSVIGYIPKERTHNYRDLIGRISAGGYIARVDAKVYKNPANDFFDVSLYLSSNEKHLPDDADIPDEANWAELPRAFHRVPADPTSAFTDEDREREKARRAQMNAEYEAQREMDSETKLGRAIKAFKAPDDQSQEVAKSDMRNGCATILAVVVVIVVLILIF